MSRRRKTPRPYMKMPRPRPIVHLVGLGLTTSTAYGLVEARTLMPMAVWADGPLVQLMYDQWWRACLRASMLRRMK